MNKSNRSKVISLINSFDRRTMSSAVIAPDLSELGNMFGESD